MTLASYLALSIVLVACLTAVATAVRSVSRIWLRHWVERRLSGATTAELYLERPQQLVLAATTAVALTVLLSGVAIGSNAEMSGWARARIAAVYMFAVLALGQLLPRAIARRWPSAVIPPLLPVLRGLELLLKPLLILARRLTGEAARDAKTGEPDPDEALGELLREGELEGVGEHTEIAIIEGVVNFGEKRVAEVMTPRDEMFVVETQLDTLALAQRVAAGGYSRVPVVEGSIDHVLGFVHAFDMLKATEDAPPLRRIGETSPHAACNDLLFRMLREGQHLAVVKQDGKTLGLVTMEDLLEELVGDIRDEHDEPSAAPKDAS